VSSEGVAIVAACDLGSRHAPWRRGGSCSRARSGGPARLWRNARDRCQHKE